MAPSIELLEKDYYRIPLIKPSRKIKFKGISFKNILSRWNKFRLDSLKEKLIAKKENLVNMNFSADQLKNKDRVEKRISRKTQAIAKLESKINFLETGNYLSEDFVDSRAIKLNSLMMNNLTCNTESLYCVTPKAAEEIMVNSSVTDIIDEEAEKIGARVREILAEKQAKRNAAQSENTESTKIDSNEMHGTMSSRKIDPEPTMVSNDEIASAIDNEMNRIKVSTNEGSMANVNKFINDDGTYRLKREDIDEDFRITRFDRSKLMGADNKDTEINIHPFSKTAVPRKPIDVKPPVKALTEIKDLEHPKFSPIISPTIKEIVEDDSESKDRVTPVVVPERNKIVQSVNTPLVSEERTTNDDIGALMARVSLLRAEKETIDGMAAEARNKATNVNAAHEEAVRKLSEYADALEAECSGEYRTINELNEQTNNQEEQINEIMKMMGLVPPETKESSKRSTK